MIADPAFERHVNLILEGIHHDPHSVLGIQPYFNSQSVIRLWRPGAPYLFLEVRGQKVQANKIHEEGLFEFVVPSDLKWQEYKIYHLSGLLAHDPYAILPLIGELDLHLFTQGVHYQLYNIFGGHVRTHEGVQGVHFLVWAPNAKRVSLVADFNHFDGRINPMRSMGSSGIWELFVPGLVPGEKYKFEIKTQTNEILVKADPFANSSEFRPATASIVADLEKFQWQDQNWLEKRINRKNQPQPLNIYEVHLGSWKRDDQNYFLNYRTLAHELAEYCLKMAYTHVELLPIAEHPLDESWGYQVSGFYSVTSRFGSPEDFQYFVNHLHQNNIGVIIDWVPGHFPKDDFSLARFDGTALYEHVDPRQGFHPHWGTYIFNFGRKEVSNFLIANALYWLDKMHVDGLRVDAVASMLYLDYGRNEGEWIPNPYGGKENLDAIEFFKHMNSITHQQFPGILTIAEESTAFTGVSHPVEYGGLGFDMKWNMGWMNDTLRYFSIDPFYRHYHHNDLTFGLLYAYSERFVLVLSHDEVVHGKNSLLGRMPGDIWQKFANLRLLISYMMCQPGKKLLFMGGEFGQWNEWYCKRSIEWNLLEYGTHRGLHLMVKDMNHFYLNHPALWEKDFDHTGFSWVDFADNKNSVISYLREGQHEKVLCVHNFTPLFHPEYFVRLPNVKEAQEVMNTDAEWYGGSGKRNHHVTIVKDANGNTVGLNIVLAPLATLIFEVKFS